MSRHDIPARDSRYTVVVGWDRSMRTFFAHVKDPSLDEDEEMVLWVGGYFDEAPTVQDLMAAVEPYADIGEEMATKLWHDKQGGH